MLLIKTRKKELLIIGIGFLVALIHLSLFSFRITEDSPCWLAVARYFQRGFSQGEILSSHCLFNPTIPLIAGVISSLFSITIKNANIIINLSALITSGLLIYRIGEYFTNKNIGLITAILFLIDFQTQYYSFAVMPDSVTWLFTLILIYFLIDTSKRKKDSMGRMLGYGILGAIATLTKMNLGFLILLTPAAIFIYRKKEWLKKGLLVISTALMIISLYYFWVASTKGALPWSSFTIGVQKQSPSIQLHLTSLIAAFLYTFPFILIGLKVITYKTKYRNLLLLIAAGIIAPILIWPYVMPRFTFSLFPLLFPIAASGMICLSKMISSSKRTQKLALVVLIIIMFMLGTLRVHLTFNNLAHLEIIKIIFSYLFSDVG